MTPDRGMASSGSGSAPSTHHSETLRVPRNPRVVVLGDSGASGLGVHGHSFGIITAELLDASERLRLARSRRLVDETLQLVDRIIDFRPDLVVFGTGMAEGLVHPGVRFEEFINRYHPAVRASSAGLEPHLLFSGNRYKRFRQRAGSMANVVIKQIGIGVTGGESRMSPKDYEKHLDELLTALTIEGIPVVLVGIGNASPWLFPRSNKSLVAYDQVQERIVARNSLVRLIRLKDVLDGQSDVQVDRLHPNDLGHRKLAEAVVAWVQIVDKPATSLGSVDLSNSESG
jgi:hypothetical protein